MLIFLFIDNARPDVGVAQRQESPIIGLKSFNNWVKSVLITRFAHPALAASPGAPRRGRMRGRVLDMGCGKGGDLTKWAKANVAEYVGLGASPVSPPARAPLLLTLTLTLPLTLALTLALAIRRIGRLGGRMPSVQWRR